MRIFILEDNPDRTERFKDLLKGHSLYFYEEAGAAAKALRDLSPFDMYFLDHDLGGEVYASSSDENTGYQVAKVLRDMNPKGQIIIHSMNTVGAGNMKHVLADFDVAVIPFPNLKLAPNQ